MEAVNTKKPGGFSPKKGHYQDNDSDPDAEGESDPDAEGEADNKEAARKARVAKYKHKMWYTMSDEQRKEYNAANREKQKK